MSVIQALGRQSKEILSSRFPAWDLVEGREKRIKGKGRKEGRREGRREEMREERTEGGREEEMKVGRKEGGVKERREHLENKMLDS